MGEIPQRVQVPETGSERIPRCLQQVSRREELNASPYFLKLQTAHAPIETVKKRIMTA
jgi:hypothetical protein